MAYVKISQLPAATALTGAEELPLVQSGVTKRASITAAQTVTATGSTTPRTLATRFAEVANVKDFGALGDGSTNDSTAINAALASGAKIVFMPYGIYRVSSQLLMYLSGTTLVGQTGTIIKQTDNMATGFTTIRIRGSNCTVKDIIFDGNNAAPAVSGDNTGVNIDTNSGTISHLVFERVRLQNFNSYGIFAFAAGTLNYLDFIQCEFETFTNTAFIPPAAIQIVQPLTSYVRVANCTFRDLTGCGAAFRSVNNTDIVDQITMTGCIFDHQQYDYTSIGVEVLNGRNVTFAGNSFKNARMGLSFNGENIAVAGNVFRNHTSYCIEAGTSKGLAVSGNTFEDFQYGIISYYGARDNAVTGNTFLNALPGATSAGNLGWAWQMSGTGAPQDYTKMVFSNNVVKNCSGIRLTRNVDTQVTGNIFETTSTDNQCVVQFDSALTSGAVISNNIFRTSVDLGSTSSGYVRFQGTGVRVAGNVFTSTTASPNVAAAVCNVASGTLTNCSVEDNLIINYDTGVRLNAGSPTVSACNISNNTYKTVTATFGVPATGVAVHELTSGSFTAFGDVAATLSAKSSRFNRWQNTLTANRTVTLETTDAYRGQTLHVTRSGAGAFNLDVGGLKTLTAAGQWCTVVYSGSAWVLVAYGAL